MRKPIIYFSISILFLGLYLGALQLYGNFHAIIPGEAYRSAQMSKGDIIEYAKTKNIKSILNLRGENIGKEWYDMEVAESKQAGIELINFEMSSGRELKQEEALKLIEIMKNAPKPILIHCMSGADRTGLASALYVAGVKKGTEFDAEVQLSLLYGHIPLWFIDAYAMNRTFERLEPYLGYHDS